MNMEIGRMKDCKEKLESLTLFRELLSHPLFDKLLKLLKEVDGTWVELSDAYIDFVRELYDYTLRNPKLTDPDLGLAIQSLVCTRETTFVKSVARGDKISPILENRLNVELGFLDEAAKLSANRFIKILKKFGIDKTKLPEYVTSEVSITDEYKTTLMNLGKTGFGKFQNYHTFVYDHRGLVQVKHPDMQRLEDLTGYQEERDKVMKNTLNFLEGKAASNVLLYGDAGTGKSSTIKAIVNELKDQGLRLVEVKKNMLHCIPSLLDTLNDNPLKFILFIDDLSFMENDDNFASLKATLEGGTASCGDNVIIYATSNRRHLVKESLSKRQGDELYLNDSLQETMSLAARFGLTITFQKPDRDNYLMIVEKLAKQYDLAMDPALLASEAEAFAIRANGRSPRTAKQFIELKKAGL